MVEWNKISDRSADLIAGAGARYLQKSDYGWLPSLKQDDHSVGYGWIAYVNHDRPETPQIYAMPPGSSAEGFVFARPELPGIRITSLRGFSGFDQMIASYNIETEDPASLAEIEAIKRSDGKFVPVLVPVITAADPVNPAAIARQLWEEIQQNWYRDDDFSLTLLSPQVFKQLAQEFKQLITALYSNKTEPTKASIDRMLANVAKWTVPDSVTPANAAQDTPGHDATPFPTTRSPIKDPANPQAATQSINRLAARALVFNLVYLRKHLEGQQ